MSVYIRDILNLQRSGYRTAPSGGRLPWHWYHHDGRSAGAGHLTETEAWEAAARDQQARQQKEQRA